MDQKDASMRLSSEANTIQLAQHGDRRALVQLFGEHLPTVHRFAMRMCRDEDRARDIAQDSLLTALKSLKDYRGDASFSTWLFTIARSHCSKARRRQAREKADSEPDASADTVASVEPAPDAHVSHGEISDAVERGLASLDEAEREVVLLRDVEGVPANDAARILSISIPALKSRLHRARVNLRRFVRTSVGEETERIEASCPDVVESFSKKLEGDLTEGACAVLEEHLKQCPACADRCDSIRRLLGACSSLRQHPPSIDARSLLEQVLSPTQNRSKP